MPGSCSLKTLTNFRRSGVSANVRCTMWVRVNFREYFHDCDVPMHKWVLQLATQPGTMSGEPCGFFRIDPCRTTSSSICRKVWNNEVIGRPHEYVSPAANHPCKPLSGECQVSGC